MIENACETCGSSFEAKSRNARYCSKACRPNHAQRKAATAKEWEEKKKAEKKRERDWLRENLPLYKGKLFNKDGSVMKGRILEEYLVDWVW